MPVTVMNRRRSPERIVKELPGAEIIDVTSGAPDPWVRLSPFYPHGGIPVPGSPGVTSQSVEGLWQALKVFENADVDATKLTITTMKNLKRTVRRYGPVRGHRDGLTGTTLLGYREARHRIYLPAYRYVLDHRVPDLVADLKSRAADHPLVLLDFTTNGDPDDDRTPLSHAALLARYLRDDYP
jgi:hypothetical protein